MHWVIKHGSINTWTQNSLKCVTFLLCWYCHYLNHNDLLKRNPSLVENDHTGYLTFSMRIHSQTRMYSSRMCTTRSLTISRGDVRVCEWQRGMHGRAAGSPWQGACVVGGVTERGMHSREGLCGGGCVHSRGMCGGGRAWQGGMHGTHAPPSGGQNDRRV